MEEIMQLHLHHFLHEQHPLKLVPALKRSGDDGMERACAAGCSDTLISGGGHDDDDEAAVCDYYACDPCRFYLHQSCASLPQRIEHFLHPSCLLVLKLVPNSPQGGRSEPQQGMMFWYQCEACSFGVDAVSSNKFRNLNSSEEEEDEEEKHLLHFSHPHPLELSTNKEEDAELRCKGCTEPVSGRCYSCQSCGYYLDEYCAKLPRKIQHFFHPCALFLESMDNHHRCDACREEFSNMFGYRCAECDFDMHVACAQFSPIGSDEEGILRFSHHHPLRLTSDITGEGETPNCRGCGNHMLGKSYGCQPCGYYLHELCADPPREIQHFYHSSCPLFLKFPVEYEVKCDACWSRVRDARGGVYHCEKCDFNMHVECAIASYGQGDRIQDLSHHHPLLMLSEEVEDDDFLHCKLCSRRIAGHASYGACYPCQFYIHKSCMGLPEKVEHHCHPCLLFLRIVKRFDCNTCSRESKLPLAYECVKCGFKMDAVCALFSTAVVEDDLQAEHIPHFCHQHSLQLFKDLKRTIVDIARERKLECLVCGGLPSGLTYGCRNCDVFLHKPCLDVLPRTLSIQNEPSTLLRLAPEKHCSKCFKSSSSGFFFLLRLSNYYYCVPCALLEALSIRVDPSLLLIEHPMHPCFLIMKFFDTLFNCNACFTFNCSSHAYYCGQCDFYVGLKCAQHYSATSSDQGEEGQMLHFCHWHPLQPSQDVVVRLFRDLCRICGSGSLEPSYSCKECDFYVHKSCLYMLPQKIDHHYLNCTLVLLTNPSYYKCLLCRKGNDSGLAFHSIERGFKLCVACFLRPKNSPNADGTFTSIHHWHQLSLVDNLEKDAYSCCLLCGGGCSSGVLCYYCRQCGGHLHRACAELPFEMQHPLHPQHPLTLISTSQLPESRRSCSLCLREFLLGDTPQSGIYHCKGCSFQLDRRCASTCIPSIRYEGERHLLTVVEHMYGHEDCRVCSASCNSSANVFRCVECKFSLHLWCGPLPCDIKHPCHVHPLILEDFHVEENYTDKFPCHICEEERNPRLPVYRCAQGCPMICGIKCAISEVMPKLLGHHGGDVRLRTTFPDQKSKVVPRDEVLKGMGELSRVVVTHEDITTGKLTFEDIGSGRTKELVQFWERKMFRIKDKELERADEDEDEDADKMKTYSFTKKAFSRFSRNFGVTQLTLRRDGIPKFISQHGGFAEWEDYFLPPSLFPIHEEFFGKYECIMAESERVRSDQRTRIYFFSILCVVLHDMRTTKMVDVTSERVRQWLTLLRLVEWGDSVQICSGFDAGFVIDKIKRVWETHFLIEAKRIVDETSDQLRIRREELSRRETRLLRELRETRKEMEEVNEQELQHHKYAWTGLKSMRKEYADALLIKWKPATAVFSDCRDRIREFASRFRSV